MMRPLYKEPKITAQFRWILIMFTIIRLCLVMDVHWTQTAMPYEDFTAKYIHSPALSSILVNPIYTLKHLREAHFLLRFNDKNDEMKYGNLYNSQGPNSKIHLPPLALAMFEPLLKIQQSYGTLIFGFMMTLVDLMISILLYQIIHCIITLQHDASDEYSQWEQSLEHHMKPLIQPDRAWVFGLETKFKSEGKKTTVDEHHKTPIIQIFDLAQFSCLLYYCNPFSILATSAMKDLSFQNILHFFILLAIKEILPYFYNEKNQHMKQPNISMAALYLSLVTYFDMYPIVLIIPMALMVRSSGTKNYKKHMLALVGLFFFWSISLQGLSIILVGKGNLPAVWVQNYGYQYGLKNIMPSLSSKWYFSVQIISVFRLFYSIIFAGLPHLVTFALVQRLYRQPFALITIFIFLWVYYKSIITMPDVIFAFCLAVVSPKSLSRMGNVSLVSVLAMPVPIALYTYDYWMWLEAGNGNPNFMYFQCVAFQVFFAIFFLDFTMASLKRDKALRVTEKLSQVKNPDSVKCD